MNAARALGDEPLLISFLIRVAGDHLALHALERTWRSAGHRKTRSNPCKR